MSVEEIRAHGKQYSKSFSSPLGKWQTDFEVMALKTVKKLNLSRWGILSVDMQTALKVDQGVLKSDNPNDTEYPDMGQDGSIDAEYSVIEDEKPNEQPGSHDTENSKNE